MVKRYELTDAQWQRIAALLPGKASDPGRTAADNRLFVNGVLWVLRSGAHWRDLPERYGKWKTVHKRFTRWAKSGVVGARVRRPHHRSRQPIPDARHHPGPRPPAGGHRKRGDQNQALGRSRGGLTTKIHMLADALGRPLRFILTGGQVHDIITAPALLEGLEGGAVIADKAYDSNALRQMIADTGMPPSSPRTRSRKILIPHDTDALQERNRIERCFNKLKHFRRFATRYDRRAAHFLAFIHLATAMIWMR